jgi:hypothetical protein
MKRPQWVINTHGNPETGHIRLPIQFGTAEYSHLAPPHQEWLRKSFRWELVWRSHPCEVF